MAYTQAQIDAEIQRKAKSGIPRNYGADPAQAQAAPGQQLLSQNPMAAPAAMQMQRYGVDPSLFGPSVTRNQAYANAGTLGTPTADIQKSLFSTLMSTAGAYGAMPTGTAAQAANLPLYNGISGYLKGLEGKQFQSTIEHNDAMQNARNSNALGWANNGISQGNLDLSQSKFDQSNFATSATNGWIADALKNPTKEEAIAFISRNAHGLANDGVNMGEVLLGIDRSYDAQSVPGGDPATKRLNSLHDKAIASAKDEYNREVTRRNKIADGNVGYEGSQFEQQVPDLPDMNQLIAKWTQIWSAEN